MTAEVLYFDGCPGYEALLPRLRELLQETGVEAAIELRQVNTPQEAEAARFLGSPSLRINGRDVEPGADTRTDFGLKCRLYRESESASPIPPPEWILAALKGAEVRRPGNRRGSHHA
ncbi:MAG: DUF2703 domain-containing protein [Thermoleophilaceae bacterium]|nr:DUF2703 domain-containing protein [Thermoleophilaceae bacterium]